MSLRDDEIPGSHEIKMTVGRQKRASPRKGGGADNPNLVIEYVGRIETLHDEIAKIKSDMMLQCKDLQAGIKEVLEQAQEKGLHKKPLRAVVKQRALEKAARAVRDDLEDINHLSAFDIMKAAMGHLGGTPLGEFAQGTAN